MRGPYKYVRGWTRTRTSKQSQKSCCSKLFCRLLGFRLRYSFIQGEWALRAEAAKMVEWDVEEAAEWPGLMASLTLWFGARTAVTKLTAGLRTCCRPSASNHGMVMFVLTTKGLPMIRS